MKTISDLIMFWVSTTLLVTGFVTLIAYGVESLGFWSVVGLFAGIGLLILCLFITIGGIVG